MKTSSKCFIQILKKIKRNESCVSRSCSTLTGAGLPQATKSLVSMLEEVSGEQCFGEEGVCCGSAPTLGAEPWTSHLTLGILPSQEAAERITLVDRVIEVEM